MQLRMSADRSKYKIMSMPESSGRLLIDTVIIFKGKQKWQNSSLHCREEIDIMLQGQSQAYDVQMLRIKLLKNIVRY
jgi:hypothetical protein